MFTYDADAMLYYKGGLCCITRGVFAPALFNPEISREGRPGPQHCVAACPAVGLGGTTCGGPLMFECVVLHFLEHSNVSESRTKHHLKFTG